MEQVKEQGEGGEKGRKCLQTNPRSLKTTQLAVMPEFAHWHLISTVISCQNWPIKCLASHETEMNFRGRVCENEFFFFCFLVCVDGVNVEISMNPNNQCRLCTFVLSICLKGRTARVKFWSFKRRSKPLESLIWSVKMWQAFNSSVFDPWCIFVQGQSSSRPNGLPFLPRH